MAALLDDMEQCRLGDRCVAMDTRRRSTLSELVVASAQLDRARLMQQYSSEDE